MSTSLGVATTEGGHLELHSLTRTSNESALPDVISTLAGISSLAGGISRGQARVRGLAAGP